MDSWFDEVLDRRFTAFPSNRLSGERPTTISLVEASMIMNSCGSFRHEVGPSKVLLILLPKEELATGPLPPEIVNLPDHFELLTPKNR